MGTSSGTCGRRAVAHKLCHRAAIPPSPLNFKVRLSLGAPLASPAQAQVRERNDKNIFLLLNIAVQICSLDFACQAPVRLSVAVAGDIAHSMGVNKPQVLG